MKVPKLESGQVSILRGQVTSGIILNNDGSIYLNIGDDYYMVFDNIDDARVYINDYLEKNNSVEFSIFDELGNYIEYIALSNASKCIKIINSVLQDWGEKAIEENKDFTMIAYPNKTRIRLLFIKPKCLEYEFIFTYKEVYIYIDDARQYEIRFDMKDIIRDNSILSEIISILFLSTIKIKEYTRFHCSLISFYDREAKLIKQIKSKKPLLSFTYGRFLESEYQPVIKLD